MEIFVVRGRRNRNFIGGVERFVPKVGLELARFGVPGMRGVEADGQAERLSVGAALQELERLIPEPRGRERSREIADPVAPLILPGEDRGAADTTNGCGDKVIPESHAVGGEAVDVRRLDEPIARTTQRVEPLIVGEDENEVGTAGWVGAVGSWRPGRAAADETKEYEGEEGVNAKPAGFANGPLAISIPGDGRAGMQYHHCVFCNHATY